MNLDQSIQCGACPILNESIFRGAPAAVHETIAAQKEVRLYRPGERLFTEGDPVDAVHCVFSGEIELRVRREGEEQPIGMASPGMLLGYREPETLGRYIISAVARSEAIVCRIPLGVILEQMKASPIVMVDLMRSLASRADDIESRLGSASGDPVS
jgi:CRP-like cAMP-binding protein